ncbi:MAG: T9SS type A sorting domain-containing protein [Bacteroidota bacterium]
MKKLLWIVIFFMGVMSFAQAQRKCGTMEHLQMQIQQDPSLESQMQAYEAQIEQWINDHQNEINASKAVITIPVVVHVVYSTTAQNITDARVAEQIAILNRDYAGLNTHSMYGFASTLKINTELQFCLAQRKPDGTATNGVERRQTTVSSFSTNDYVKLYSKGGLDAWDPTKYMNIWVCNLGGGLCGYAQFPTSGVNSTFGVVINYQYFGQTDAVAPYNLGGTTSHEIGHCFNLYHIWGDDGTACTGTDYCADVPNQAGPNYGVPVYPHVTCTNGTNGDMFINFMDYSDDIAYANFTPNQKARIQACFASGGLLYSLSVSDGCQPATAACGTPTGLTVSAITNTGATLGWTAVSGATSYNVQYKVSTATTWMSTTSATTSKVLTGLTAASNYMWQVQAVCSTGGGWSAGTFITTGGSGCTDTYEPNESSAAAKLIAVNTDVFASIGTSIDKDYFKFTTTSAAKKVKVTLTALPGDYDMKLYKGTTLLATSQNTGTTSETIIYNATSTGTYYVYVYGYSGAYNAASCYDLKAQTSSTSFRTANGESLDEPNTPLVISMYPNPAGNNLTLEYNTEFNDNSTVNVYDMSGRLVLSNSFTSTKGLNTWNIDLSQLMNGLYMIELINSSDRIINKIMVEK